jgi:hypothetical protein
MPDFTQWNVPSPFPNILYNPAAVDAAIAKTQSELGNLDINRRELALRENKFAQGASLGDEFAKSITGDGTTGTTSATDSTPFERKMGFSEGGGTADKVNSEGYAGQYQFGAARLADLGLYTPAQGEDLKRNEWKGTFKIAPYGVANLQDFLKNPAAQHAAFVAHVADVDKVIDATPGADKFDRNGLRAVAHLGGNGGMQAFIASGGNLNRADSNGTSLKAYYQKFADGGAPLLQKAFGAPHGPGGPQSNLPTVQPGRLAGWVDPNAPLPVPPIPPAVVPPAFNPNTGPRVAGASPAGAPGVVSAVTPQAAPGITPPRAVGDDPNGPAPTPTVTGQADETAPVVAQTKTATRLNGTDVAGPPGVVPAPPEAQPNRMAYGTGLPGVTIGLPTNGLAPPPQATAPVVTAAAPPAQAQPQQPPPAPSRVISREPLIQSGMARGLTRDQALNAARLFKSGADPAAVLQHIDQLRHQNDVIRQGDATQAAIDEKENYARRHQSQQDQIAAADKKEAQRVAAEHLRLAEEGNARERERFEKGATQAERDDYNLRAKDPSSTEYLESYGRKKWQMSPNGTVIENDMSNYAAPTRPLKRPTYVPAPTGTALDEVRKADNDGKNIMDNIDRYLEVFGETRDNSWGAYFDNPTSPKAQKLLGAFSVLKTTLRSPLYLNTGVLQPGEIPMLNEEVVSPRTIRGLYATPEALAARLGEIKRSILQRRDTELRSVGRPGVIVHDKADFDQVPIGAKFYDKEGNRRTKISEKME